MKVYIDGVNYYEDETKTTQLDEGLAVRMMQSGCGVYIKSEGEWSLTHNKYKFIDMINIVSHLLKQCKSTLVADENPLKLCEDIQKKLTQMIDEMPKDKDGFKL